jgi:pyruvate dehydrogenase E1 component alpha subunit
LISLENVDIPREKLIDMYRRMQLIRRFEYTVKDLFARAVIIGALHLYVGQEAVAVGAISNLRPDDYVMSTHRGHGHLIARGADVNRMMAELYGKEDGLCKGKGGSMHMADMKLHVFAQPVVAGGVPLAVGAALASKMSKKDGVALAFFGDGASNQGSTHESMNLASIWKLPVVFICENNQYAESTAASYAVAGGSVAKRGAGYSIPSETVDGMDVLAVYKAVNEAVGRARRGEGPSLLECVTYRYEGHEEGDPWETYRTKQEVEEWKKRDPITNFGQYLVKTQIANEKDLESIRADVERTISNAISYAEKSPLTNLEEAMKDVFTDSYD